MAIHMRARTEVIPPVEESRPRPLKSERCQFSYLLLRGRMVPVSLALWGVFSSVLLIVGLPLQIAGFLTGPLTGYQWVPAIAFAPVFALWLLVKGVTMPKGRQARVQSS